MSLQLDAQVFGVRAWVHLTNLLFHTANTVLLFLVLARITGAALRSAVVAALFGLHPLHVESVAWVAERKDVLSTFFWIATMGAYALYVEKPHWGRYVLVVAAYGFAVLSKPMVVTLPCVLLLLDYWPLRRIGMWSENGRWGKPAWASLRPILMEKIPLFVLSVLCSVATWVAQERHGAVRTLDAFPLAIRIGNAALAYLGYLDKTVWPVDLAAFYPHAGTDLNLAAAVGAGLLLLAITGFVLWYATRFPYLPVGWFWYLGTLVPVIGLVQVGVQGMADRYTYVPLIGVFLAVVWGVGDLVSRRSSQTWIAAAFSLVLLLILAIHTWTQAQVWQSDETLWRHAAKVTEKNSLAHKNLALALIRAGQLTDAIREFESALAIDPQDTEACNNLGVVYMLMGDTQAGMARFHATLRMDPTNQEARNNLARALKKSGSPTPAVEPQ